MKKSGSSISRDRLNRQERLQFVTYLAHSLDNGFSLNDSLHMMPALWPRKKLLMQKLVKEMAGGFSLAAVMKKLGFNKTTCTQVNMAMQQGNLSESLQQIGVLQRIKNEQIRKLETELSYPFILVGMMVFLLAFMQAFVLKQLDGDSNEHTGDLILSGLILAIIVSACLLGRGLRLLAKQDYKSLTRLAAYPLVGKTIRLYAHYLIVYDIALLLAGGFSLQQMCAYAGAQEEGSLQQAIGQKVAAALEKGQTLAQIIKSEKFLPNSLLILLQSGSSRKKLGQRCLLLGRSLFQDLSNQVEKLVINVQPYCFILIGICIIGMYLKLLLPMYSLMQGL